jgi:hypothetical protein
MIAALPAGRDVEEDAKRTREGVPREDAPPIIAVELLFPIGARI